VSLSHLFFLLSVASLPVQLNKFFFITNSYVLGIPIDYRAPALYLSDIFIILAITTTAISYRSKLTQFVASCHDLIIPALIFTGYLMINSLTTSSDKVASVIFTFKIIELTFYVVTAVFLLSQKKIRPTLQKILKITIAWQSTLAIAQFVLQKSLGLYILGERSFDVGTSQIAHISLFGTKFLRSYGTFPHPNVLAAFLLVAVVASNLKISANGNGKRSVNLHTGDKWLVVLAALGILLTFSKTAIFLGIFYALINTKKPVVRVVFITLTALILSVYLKYFTQTYIETVAERILLSQVAINISQQNPIFGVGANNFILHLANLNLISIGQVRLLQPVHNVFLLVTAENGIIGLILLSALLIKAFEKATKTSSIFLCAAVLTYLSVDHFLWTLHQGQMLLFLTIALIYSSKKKP